MYKYVQNRPVYQARPAYRDVLFYQADLLNNGSNESDKNSHANEQNCHV